MHAVGFRATLPVTTLHVRDDRTPMQRGGRLRSRDHGCTGCGTWGRPLWHSPELELVVVFADIVGLWVEGRSRSIGGLGSRPSTGRSRTPWRGLLTCGRGPSPR
jgi:hypothetical protein